MRNLVITLFASFTLLACQQAPPTDETATMQVTTVADSETQNSLIINLTSDVYSDAHPSLMAINFATKALESGNDVTIFMNVHGVKLASTDASSIEFNSENLHAKIKAFTEMGGTVLACPMCLKIHGIDENSLAEGIEVSGAGIMMDKLANSPTVFTY